MRAAALQQNTAVELSRLGRKVTIVGGIGNDDLGNIALRSLIKAGVNVDPVIRRSDWKTGCAAIRSMEKSKSILTAGFIDPTVVSDYLRTLHVQQGDHLHFSWALSQEMHDQLWHWRRMGISLSWETDGRMDMRAEHPRPLSNGYSGARANPDVVVEDGARLVEIVASIEHAQDMRFVLGPKLDLVEIAVVRIQRVAGSSSDQSLIALASGDTIPLVARRRLGGRRRSSLACGPAGAAHPVRGFASVVEDVVVSVWRRPAFMVWRRFDDRRRGTFWSA